MTTSPQWLRQHVLHAHLWRGQTAQRIAAELGYPLAEIAQLVEEVVAGNQAFERAEIVHGATITIEDSRSRIRSLAARLCQLPDAQSPAIAGALADVDQALASLHQVIMAAVQPSTAQGSMASTIAATDSGQASAAIAQPTPTQAAERPAGPHHPPVAGPSRGVGGVPGRCTLTRGESFRPYEFAIDVVKHATSARQVTLTPDRK